jgi:hypothetical protein
MKLQIGERLPGSGPANQPGGYVVTEVIGETPWSGLYGARRVFYNFDFNGKRPRETDEKEWLEVLLRTVNYPVLDSAAYVAGRRALARAEGQAVLANRTSNLWPEPLDLLEVANTRDPFTYARGAGGQTQAVTGLGGDSPAREPIVVFARRHGDPLVRWLQGGPRIGAVLSVVAELLEFLAAAHADGVLLNGLGPSSLLVDRAGRLHYLGTDAAVPLSTPAAEWQPFFPPERYPRGYSAPECFDPAAPRDTRTDVYAWAAVAYLVLTDERPAQLAFEQGQPWARFGDAQFTRAVQVLKALPDERVAVWAEQLGIDGAALRGGWPDNFVNVLRLCLSPDPSGRPSSAAELRSWILAPPPPPPSAVLALRLPRSDTIRIAVAVPEAGLEVIVRRGVSARPQTPEQGERVADGPLAAFVEDTFPRKSSASGGDPDDFTNSPAEAVRYSAFTRRRSAGGIGCSGATPAHLLDPYPANLRKLAEGKAAPGAPDDPEPPIVALLFQALDPTRVAESLLASGLPQVRGWALRRVAEARGRAGASASLETLLWRALQDPVQALRLDAARGLLAGPAPSEPLLRRLFETLAASHPQDCATAARLVKPTRIREEVLRPILRALKLDVPTNCPVCAVELTDRDRVAHLVGVHGYLEVGDALLPRAEGLARLWERVFGAADAAAHERLCRLLLPREAAAYVAALETEIARRAGDQLADRRRVARLVQCLRQDRAARGHFAGLLRSADARVREVGREVLLPDLAELLASESLSAADIRKHLDALCPADLIDEKLLLCQRLAPLGVAADAAEACARQLQAEKLVACSECGKPIPQGEYDGHLRRVHHIYEFRGVRYTLQQTVATLLGAVCGSSPDGEAWAALESVAREEQRERADAVLSAWLGKKLLEVAVAERPQVAGAAAEAIAASGSGPRLVPALASPTVHAALQPGAGLLALELIARLPSPLPEELMKAVRPLLAERKLPREARVAGVAALLRTTGKRGPAALEVIRAHIEGVSKARSIQVLRELERDVGQLEGIDALCAELEDQVRLSCPRCRVELARAEMTSHLWDKHRLVLDGRRVREPAKLLEEWVEDYRLEKDPAVVERCRELAARLDPEQGVERFDRLLLQQGIDDADARRQVLEQVRREGMSACPRCWTVVAPPVPQPPLDVYLGKLGMSCSGYRVEVRDGWLSPRLEVRTPDALVYRGVEPGQRWTRLGATVFLAGPLLVAAGVLGFLRPAWGELPPWVPAAACGGAALLVALLVRLIWRAPGNPRDRALRHAWRVLVPRLARKGFSPEGLALTAGLAEASIGRGDPRDRAAVLKAVREAAEEAARADPSLGVCAGLVARLGVEDRGRAKEDAASVLADELVRCLTGELPLSFAAGLLRPRDVPGWDEEEQQRLGEMLAERAAEAGLEAADLFDLGRACEPLAALVAVSETARAERRSRPALRPALERNAVECPGCKGPLVPCAGEAGIPVGEDAAPAAAAPAAK